MATKSNKWVRWMALMVLTIATLSFTQGLYIQAKAVVAQWLLADAWEQTLAGNKQVKPWAWADIWPVAQLKFGGDSSPENFLSTTFSTTENLLVLNEASGQGLAFGPGQIDERVLPGEPGWLIIGGHRDTHFRFLENIELGETIQLQSTDGRWHLYKIDQLQVVDSREQLLPLANEISEPGLMLVTCYPFDTATSGSLRYVVTGRGVVF